MKKICLNCKKEFVLQDSELQILKNLEVPEPGFCPSCRLARRLSYFNLKTLHKRKCDKCQKDIFSIYPQEASFPVYCPECYWSDGWDALDYGKPYNPNKSFFEQFFELERRVPHLSLQVDFHRTESSDYVNGTGEVKNSYLAFNSDKIDNVFYAYSVSDSYRSFLCAHSSNIENSYGIYSSTNLNSCSFLENCDSCIDVHYGYNLKNCQNCFMCSHLSNKQYHIFNKEYSKEEYEKIVSKLKNGSHKIHEKVLQEYENFKAQFPKRSINALYAENIEGDEIYESKNVYNSFNIIGGENVFHSQMLELGPVSNVFDYSFYGDSAELVYDTLNSGSQISKIKWTMHSTSNLFDIEYSAFVHNSSYIFGSVGVRGKRFVILNKEYEENEWFKLKEKIISDMKENPYFDSRGVPHGYGEFFPAELSPFYFEDSMLAEYMQISKDEAKSLGLRVKEGKTQKSQVPTELSFADLPDATSDASSDLAGKSISCKNASSDLPYCKKAFRITKKELEFLKENNLPLPRLCVSCREKELLKERSPWILKEKVCACQGDQNAQGTYKNKYKHKHEGACGKKIKSAKEGDNIYCEDCYDSEFLS